jgi:hypothetical protein
MFAAVYLAHRYYDKAKDKTDMGFYYPGLLNSRKRTR